ARRPELRVVVIDPRRNASCELADLVLQLRPGSDAFLFNGLLHWLWQQGKADQTFVAAHCSGLDAALAACEHCDADTVAQHTGLPREQLLRFYQWFGETGRSLSFYSQGINQSATGTDKCNAIINCHLLTGRLGRPGMGPFS